MIKARMKVVGEGCYYHLINRIPGYAGDLPFGDIDKEYGFRLLQNLSRYFLIEVISAVWMGNHFHLVVYAPSEKELPEFCDIAERHNSYYDSMKTEFKYGIRLPHVDLDDVKTCREIGLKMIDISCFMRAYQQRFAIVFNKVHQRRGTLWGSRFKSVILDRNNSLSACIAYVELNPVRAGMVEDPAEYKYSTWGRCNGTEHHMFRENFVKHLKKDILTENMEHWDNADVFNYFKKELAQIIASERGGTNVKIIEDQLHIARNESMPVRFLQRTRHFTDGAIIGAKLFIRETAMQFQDQSRVKRKIFSRGRTPGGIALYCFRRLRI